MAVEYAFDIYPANDPFGKISTTDSRLVRMTVADQLEDAEFWPSLYGAGKGFLEIHGDHPDAQHLQRRGYVAVVRIDTTPDRYIGGFFLDEGDFKALSRQEQRGRVLHFGGAGGMSYFDRYRLINFVYAPGQTNRGSYNVPGKWTWDNISPGGILVRLLEEGFNAPAPAPYAAFNWEFTRAVDSNGNPWLEAGDYQVDIGTGGSQVLADQIKRGLIVQVGYSLDVTAYRDISEFRTDRTSATFAAGKVRFEAGVNILNDLPKRVAAKRERTHVLMRGKEGNYVLVDEDTELNPVNLGEPYYDFLQDDTTSAVSTLTRKGQVYLERLRDTSDQCEVEHLIGPGGVDGEEGYDPGPDGDYWLGDLVTVHTGTADFDYDEQPIEVASIRYFLRDGQWVARASLGAQYTDSRSLGAQQQTAISSIIQQLITDVQRCEPDQLLDSGILDPIGQKVLQWPGGGAALTGSIADLEALGQEGDIYLADASIDAGGSRIPVVPGSWNAIGLGGESGGALSGVGLHGAWKPWVDGDTTVGSWDDTHYLIVYLLRGTLTADPIGGIAGDTGDTGDIALPAVTLEISDGSSRIFSFAVHESEDIADNAMTGTQPMTAGVEAMGGQHGSWYTDGVTAFGAHSVDATDDDHVGHSFEIKAGTPASILRDGHELLVGSAYPKVKRCDDTEHWHAEGSDAPTVNDDRSHGFRLGTAWQNDDGEVWFCWDTTDGAAVWVQVAAAGGAPVDATYLVTAAHADLTNEVVVGATPGGELGGTWAAPTVDATHAGSTHSAATDTHIADATDAHDASAISVLDTGGNFVGTDVEAVLAELDAAIGGGGHTEDHDHDGSPTQKLIQANTHESPDTDAGTGSLHHTIGSGATQAAAGNHSHGGGSGLVGVGLAIYHTIPMNLAATGTDNTANAALLVPIIIPCTMRILGLRVLVGTNGAGTHEWGLFDYSSDPTSCTKLAGGSGGLSPGAGTWGNIGATGLPVIIAAGAYALIFKFPAATTASIRITAGVAGCGAKRVTGYTWDDTPNLTTGFADSGNVPHFYLRGEYANGTDY